MNYDKLIIPAGKKAGCLPRVSHAGEVCGLFSEKVPIIDPGEWSNMIGEVELRSFVKKIKDQDGVGCHDDHTEVLTENGWKLWSEYDGRAALATVHPVTRAMEFQTPLEFHAYEYDGPLHYVHNRSHDIAVTPNHRMLVRGWNELQRRIVDDYTMRRMDEIGWYCRLMAAPSSWAGVEFTGLRIGNREYTGDDFIAFLGMLISDGWAGGSESTLDRVSYCCFKPHRIEYAREIAHRIGFAEQTNRPGVFCVHDMALANWCRANVYANESLRSPTKRVPQLVKCADTRQLALFLEYFGDKSITNGRCAFTTTSPWIVDDLQEILLRLGSRSGIYSRPMRGTTMADGRVVHPSGNTDYTVTQWTTDRVSLEGKKVAVEPYRGMVYCATVPNSTLITRRNGKTLISGNSCATESTSQAVEIVRHWEGQEWVELNPWSLYYFSSGGRDNGSSIDTNLQLARDQGICPESLWPRSKGWEAKPSTEAMEAAKLYTIEEFYDITTIAEFGTALLLGFPVVFGWSGHSVVATQLLTTSTFEYANSWAPSWGDQGYGTLRLSSVSFQYGAFAVRTANLHNNPLY